MAEWYGNETMLESDGEQKDEREALRIQDSSRSDFRMMVEW